MHRRDFLRQSLWGAAALLPLSALPLGSVAASVAGKRYYVDGAAGDDERHGDSETQAWRSLKRLNQVQFEAGDQIWFKRGGDYPGVFAPKGSGAAGSPVVVDAYGSGALPHLHADGGAAATVLLQNIEYWSLRNLAISNQGSTPAPRRTGVHLYHQDFGAAHDIVLQGLSIHDVNGVPIKKAGGGSAILIEAGGKRSPSHYESLHILDNTIARSQRDGILFLAAGSRQGGLAKDVIVRGNRLSEVPGDCILVKGCDGALVERNTVSHCAPLPTGEAAAGIWPFDCDNSLIQYNEVSGHQAPKDGQGFDADFKCRNTVIQYNYSHDNSGGMALVCNDGRDAGQIGNHGTIVRYNLSINDALRKTGTASLHLNGPVDDSQIYNNIIIIPDKPIENTEVTVFKAGNWKGTPNDTAIHDNIVLSPQSPAIDMQLATQTLLGENSYFAGNGEAPPAQQLTARVDPQLLKRYSTYRPNLDQAVALVKSCFADGKPVSNALTLIANAAA